MNGNKKDKLNILKNNYCNNELFNTGVQELESVLNDLNERGIKDDNYDIDLTIARGLDYYTGSVYETMLVDYPNIGSVCSGGRYDNLAEYYTDKKLPGVGASIGLTRLFYQLVEAGIVSVTESSSSDILILPMCEDYKYIYKVNNILRDNDITTNICYIDKGFKQKMKYANKLKNKYIIIIGEDEVNKNVVVLKNMIDGNQEEITIDNLNKIKEYLN